MATYTPDQYQKLWRARARAIKRAGINSSRDAATFMRNTAKGMAPQKSGELRQGITFRSKGEASYEVTSSVPGDFPYQMWVNQTAPYRTLHFGSKGGWIPPARGGWTRVFKPNSTVVYGDGSHRVTGTPRFWHLSTLRTRDIFPKMARANLQKALRLQI